MKPRIKLTPYYDELKVNGAWVREIWLVTDEQTRRLGFASKKANGLWSAVFSHPSSSEVIKRICPTFRTVKTVVSVALEV